MHKSNGIRPFGIFVFVIRKIHNEEKYLLIRRSGERLSGIWEMVAGKCEENELVWQGALREIKEETDLIVDELYSADYIEAFYEFRYDMIVHFPVFAAFVKDGQEVRLSPDEHDAFAWLSYVDARQRLEFDGQKKALDYIQNKFVETVPNKWLKITIP
ncbi:MAG TPA: NUDIX domain-containing protein [Candidatus Babeliales bacterium]|nr:NUDIX domain-containing protein [Candidatus Babeliales bacterium]